MKQIVAKQYSFAKHRQHALYINRARRAKRVRTRLIAKRKLAYPRLSVFRSHKYIYAEVIDDQKGITLAHAQGKLKDAFLVGQDVAAKAREKRVSKILYDRGRHLYHGHVKELAKGARKGGLQF